MPSELYDPHVNNIIIDVESKDSTNSDDLIRLEEHWSSRNEKFLRKIQDDCLLISKNHYRISKRNKKLYIFSSIPTMIMPLILANLSILWDDSHQYINSVGLILVGVINGLQLLFNFSKKAETHNTFSGRYSELVNDISKILIRKKRFRSAFDVILERITERKNSLDEYAPTL